MGRSYVWMDGWRDGGMDAGTLGCGAWECGSAGWWAQSAIARA
jgi:hypothetical protein